MPPLLLVRLWVMVFLHYFVWGTWYVTMGTYISGTLHFEEWQTGLAYGSTAVGAMVSPFLVGIVADRFFATQRILAFLHLLGAALLYGVSLSQNFGEFYPMLLAYTISYMAGHGLTSSLTLHHCQNPAKEFPMVMMMASVGWIVAGLTVSWMNFEDNVGMFQLSAGAAFVMGLYSLTLPHTPPKAAGTPATLGSLLGFDALKLMRDRSFATFMVCSFLICIPLSFYFTWAGSFLKDMKIENAAAKMTLGQVSDVVFILLLPALLTRIGAKGILMLGIGAWTVRFGLFALFHQNPSALWMLFTGILLHGMCYDFIFVMGRMYVDKRAGEDIRGAAQGLHAIVTLGAGMFVGSWLSGVVAKHYKVGEVYNWQGIWLVPAVMAAVLLVVFGVLFQDKAEPSPPE